ncbi:GNAT family N-acetyltransferase [Mycolicibacterium sp. Dal123E01]|uniref:GNAT family N-acetyltransferase n=1 Tax=Mycolicibacterium sp. Dal123E01 TaxID=3457578 RepID=UPI00403E96B3
MSRSRHCDDARMTIEVRRSGPADRAAILRLIDAARGTDLSASERAERGFVQGAWDETVLAQYELGPGVFVAVEQDGTLAGFAMTSEPGTSHDGPPKLALDAAQVAVGEKRLFMYGPVAVDPNYQGRGVLTSLLSAAIAHLRDTFDIGVLFIEDANRKSLAVHRHYGMTEVPGFTVGTRDYHVLTFDLAHFSV